MAPLCLQGAVQVLLFFFHFPDMFWVSGKLPPIILTALCLARLLHDVVWLKSVDRGQTGSRDELFLRCSFVIFGMMKSCATDLPPEAEPCVCCLMKTVQRVAIFIHLRSLKGKISRTTFLYVQNLLPLLTLKTRVEPDYFVLVSLWWFVHYCTLWAFPPTWWNICSQAFNKLWRSLPSQILFKLERCSTRREKQPVLAGAVIPTLLPGGWTPISLSVWSAPLCQLRAQQVLQRE